MSEESYGQTPAQWARSHDEVVQGEIVHDEFVHDEIAKGEFAMQGSSVQFGEADSLRLEVPTAEAMREVGAQVARIVRGGDVIALSGPLGAGKTTWAQGFGAALGVQGPMVSPTFTIARQLRGKFADGNAATLVHVDAYRLGGNDYAPGEDVVSRLLDELESLGLDEMIDAPQDDTVVLMEWGEQMAAALAQERLEVRIERPVDQSAIDATHLTEDGLRIVYLIAHGGTWRQRLAEFGAQQQR